MPLRSFAGLPGASVEGPESSAKTLGRLDKSRVLVDALHVDAAAGCKPLLTADLPSIDSARSTFVEVNAP